MALPLSDVRGVSSPQFTSYAPYTGMVTFWFAAVVSQVVTNASPKSIRVTAAALFAPYRSFPVAPIRMEYSVLFLWPGFMLNVSPDISKELLSVSPAPATRVYVGSWLSSLEF